MADELRLPVQNEPLRRAVEVGLEIASINLYECRPDTGLAGYGKVGAATAAYLERKFRNPTRSCKCCFIYCVTLQAQRQPETNQRPLNKR